MAHVKDTTTNIISKIKLPNGTEYEVHDASAIHDLSDLQIATVLDFRGTKSTENEIKAITSAKVGHVYLCTGNNTEYVCITAINGTANANAWEKLGNIHDAASSDHTHDVTVTGTNGTSTVTGTVVVPVVTATQKKLAASSSAPVITPTKDNVLGADTSFTASANVATTKIKATATGVAVGANGTDTAITGLGTPTTDAALGVGATFKTSGGTTTTKKLSTTTIKNPTVSSVTIPNVTGNTAVEASKLSTAGSVTAGGKASWSATVNNGVLSFDFTANTPTAVTLPTFTTVSATNTVLGNNLSASSVTTSDVTVATGGLGTTGGADVVTAVGAVSVQVDNTDAVEAITDLGTPAAKTFLTGVKVTSQPTVTIAAGTTGDVTVATGVDEITVAASGDVVSAMTSASASAPTITLDNNAASGVDFSVVSVTSAERELQDGVAAAQKWTQKSGSTGAPKN